MALRRIVNLEPSASNPNAGTATFNDGSSLYAPLAQLQPYYDRQKQMGTTGMLAQNGPAPISNASTAPPAAQPVASDVPQYGPGSQQDLGMGLARAGVTHGDLQTARAMAEVDPRISPLDVLAAKKQTVVAPRPAINEKTAASMIAMPSSKAVTTEGARPVDEERLSDVERSQEAATHAVNAAAITTANATAEASRAQYDAATQLRQRMQEQQDAAQRDFDFKHEQLMNEVDAASRQQVDPQRWFKQHGAVGSMMALIGSSILEAQKGYTGNAGGPSMLERFINQDIAAQENEIGRKGQAANNKLADLSRQWGSLEAGRAALRLQDTALAASQAQSFIDSSKNQVAIANAKSTLAQINARMQQQRYDLYAASQGTKRESENYQMMIPQKAQAGGIVTKYDFGGLAGAVRERAKTEYEQGEKAQSEAGKISEQLNHNLAAKESVAKFYDSIGLVRGEDGKYHKGPDFDEKAGPYGIMGKLRSSLGPFAGSKLAPQTQRQVEELNNAAHAVSRFYYSRAGGGGTDESGHPLGTVGDFAEAIHGKSAATVEDAANSMMSRLEADERGIRAGASARGSQAYDVGVKRESESFRNEHKKQGALDSHRVGRLE